MQKENYRVVQKYIETYRNDLGDNLVENQKYRIHAFLVPKLGNHASSSDIDIEFINVNKLTEEELKNYEQGVAFIKGVENPFKLRPSKIVEILSKNYPSLIWRFISNVGNIIEPGQKKQKETSKVNILVLLKILKDIFITNSGSLF